MSNSGTLSRTLLIATLCALLAMLSGCGEVVGGLSVLNAETGIVAANASRVQLLGSLGRGELVSITLSPGGGRLAVSTTTGLWVYDTDDLDAAPRLFSGHDGAVAGTAFAPDGTRMVSTGSDGTVRVWDVVNGRLLQTLERGQRTLAATYSADGALVATVGQDQTVQVWDVVNGVLAARGTPLVHDERITSVSFNPVRDGEGNYLLAVGTTNQEVYLWVVGGQNVRVVQTLSDHNGIISDVAFSPDGVLLASSVTDFSGADNTVHLWRLERAAGTADAPALWESLVVTPGTVLRGHSDWVRSVRFSPISDSSGYRLVSTSDDETVRVWFTNAAGTAAEPEHTLRGHSGKVLSAVYNVEGTRLYSASSDGSIRVWNLADSRQVAVLRGFSGPVFAVAFSPDGRLLATGSQDNVVRLWDTTSGQEVAALRGHDNTVTSVAFSPDGTRLASGSRDTTVWVWDVRAALRRGDLAAGDELRVLGGIMGGRRVGHIDEVRSVVFSPDSAMLASAGCGAFQIGTRICERGEVRLWDVNQGIELAILSDNADWAHTDWVESIAFNTDGSMLASSSHDTSIKLWDVETGRLMTTLRGHRDQVDHVAFNPDGALLASASTDDTARVWRVRDGEPLLVLASQQGSLSCAGLPADQRAAAASAGLICADITGVAFSPSGTVLATSGADNSVRLWEARSGTQLALLGGHAAPARAVAFRPDGTLLASGGADGIVLLWGVP